MAKTDNGLEHLLKSSGARPFIPKNNKFKPELFDQKFSQALIKTLQLKGINFKLLTADSKVIHAPQISELPEKIQIKPFKNSHINLGLIAFSEDFLSELIHKMMGGSDKVDPGPLPSNISPLQQKVINSFDPALANCLREGIKIFLGLDIIKVQPELDQLKTQEILEGSNDYFVAHYTFQGLTKCSLIILLKTEVFAPSA